MPSVLECELCRFYSVISTLSVHHCCEEKARQKFLLADITAQDLFWLNRRRNTNQYILLKALTNVNCVLQWRPWQESSLLAADVIENERDLMLRAAWLSCAGRMTQAEIAVRLGVSRVKINRMLLNAEREGTIRHVIADVPTECYRLEHDLVLRYGLEMCRVVPNAEKKLPVEALAPAAVKLFEQELTRPGFCSMGIGHGRTLEAVAQGLFKKSRKNVRFVSLLGCFNRVGAAGPFDVIHTLSAKTGAESFYLPAPLFAESIADKRMLVKHASVSQVLEHGRNVDCVFMGLGGLEAGSHIVQAGMLSADEFTEINRAGGVGDMLGHFYDIDGQLIDCETNSLSISLDFNSLARCKRVVAVAGGAGKAAAVLGCLRSKIISMLVTDDATAREVIQMDQELTNSRVDRKVSVCA